MQTYLITGATGYIGSMLIRFLLDSENQERENIHIMAPVRNVQDALRLFPRGVEFLQMDLCDRRCAGQLLEMGRDIDYVVHCASVTKSAEMIAHPVEVIASIVNTTQNILEYVSQCRIKSMVYLSSMEVYGNIDCRGGRRATEEEACRGEVELLSARSCYPLGKRMAENLCFSYYKEYAVPIKIARLAQTFGGKIRDTDQRVFAQFARAVKSGEDIVLHTDGSSMGNYCGIHDAIAGIMAILEKGNSGEAYNVVNEANTMTIRQMAELVAGKIADGKIKVVCDIPKDNRYGYAAGTGLRMSGQKLEKLGWKPKESLCDMYRSILESEGGAIS